MSGMKNSGAKVLPYGGIFLAFILYMLCFEPFGMELAAFVFAIPVYLAAKAKAISFKKWALFTAVGCYLAWGIMLIWLRHVYPPAGYVAALGLPIAVSFFVWIWFAALYYAVPKTEDAFLPRLARLLALAGLWVVLEWVRSWIFTGFPWLCLAHSQWRMPANIYAAGFGGVWIVSFIVIFFNMALAEYACRIRLWHRSKLRGAYGEGRPFSRMCPEFYLALMFLISGVWAYAAALPRSLDGLVKVRVGFVQTNFEGILKWEEALAQENLNVVANLTNALKCARVDIAILPEAATPPRWPIIGMPQIQRYFEALSRNISAPILTGNVAYFEDPAGSGDFVAQNAAFAISPKTGLDTENFYAKRKLVPFGEYVPFWAKWAVGMVLPDMGVKRGERAVVIPVEISGRQFKAGTMICYEDIFPACGLDQARLGADFLFVCTNDSWYGKEAGAWQHASHSALQAASTGLPLMRASNNGLSCVFDKFGRMGSAVTLRDTDGNIYSGEDAEKISEISDIVNENGLPLNPYNLKPLKTSPLVDDFGSIYFRGAGYADLLMAQTPSPTFYVKYGDWFVCLSALFMLSPILFRRRNGQ